MQLRRKMASPEPTVTIHRGELAQIKKLITKSRQQKPARGQFYGLWTHSFQPVIQVVVGLPGSKANKKDSEEYFSKCEKIITECHGLRLLGEWLGAVPNRGQFCKYSFDLKKFCVVQTKNFLLIYSPYYMYLD